MKEFNDFEEFFRAATGDPPFPYQRRLANGAGWPGLIEVPTGLGKTLSVVLAWLWRRREAHAARGTTPRRLVYCLPMRVLVEQTGDVVAGVLERLGLSTKVVVLTGGVEAKDGWDTHPEDDLVIIGTQDMLLSRALNRGYGMSRYRWPLHFGLLNNDCLWIVDEVQLAGSGLATTTQLQALRRKLGTLLPTQTSWMSATISEQWLRSVDVGDTDLGATLGLDEEDQKNAVVKQRLQARKTVSVSKAVMGDARSIAAELAAAHRPGTRTIAVVNTVERSRELFAQLEKAKTKAQLVLVHSRFRPGERGAALARATASPPAEGTIVVSTQVIEAGVDLTSSTLFTEVASWASLVQRLGRCNRRGESEDARVFWIPLPREAKESAKLAKPYELAELVEAQAALERLKDGGPASLPKHDMHLETGLVLRRRDLLDLFDTTPDLMGNDVDVSRFIRDGDDHDVQVFWRDLDGEPAHDERSPARAELCAVPVGVAREWQKSERPMWRWDGLAGEWARVDRLVPGMALLLRADDGGYDSTIGLAPKSAARVEPVRVDPSPHEEDRRYDGDPESEWNQWYLLSQHSADVASEAARLAATLGLEDGAPDLEAALVTAARWHDAGKAHPIWQQAAKRLGEGPPDAHVAKSLARRGRLNCGARRGFRHELASALLALQSGQSDLVSFLVACHHGKVRVSLRALPGERAPEGSDESGTTSRYARGVWEGDELPEIDLGDGLRVASQRLTLRYMELGDDEVTGPSWISRVMALRDSPNIGPFRLGFLEALIKCADERASRRAQVEGPP